jgi:hypothetical protein
MVGVDDATSELYTYSARSKPRIVPDSQFKQVFVAGALRSGTTMLGLMLRQHPRIEHFGEWDFLFDVVQKAAHEPTPGELRNRLQENRIYREHKIVWSPEWSSYREAIHGMASQKMTGTGLFGANIHRNFENGGLVEPTDKRLRKGPLLRAHV